MAERRWVGPASVVVLVLLIASTVAAVVVSQRQLDTRLRSLAETAAATVRQDVELNLQRDVAAVVGLARSLDDVTTVDADRWTGAVDQVARAGVFTDISAVNLLTVSRAEDLDATLGSLPDSVRDVLDLRLGDGPLHAVGTAVWPEPENQAVLGYDVFLNPQAAPAVRAAILRTTVQATAPLQVVQEPEDQRAIVVYVPVVPEPGGAATGAISLVFRAGALLDDAVARLPRGAAVRWTDGSVGLEGDAALLADAGTPVQNGAVAVEVFNDLGRTFRLDVTLPATALGTAERRVPLLVGALGAVLCLGLVLTSAAWQRTTRRADQLAARRTAALATTTAELEAANRELRELDRLKDRMIGTVSHDLRSPLTVIRGASQMLLERSLTDEQRQELTRRVLRQTSRLRGLIDELLVSAQARGGALRADRRALDLRPVIATIIDDLGIGQLEPEPGEVPAVLADQIHVERVLHNLLVNAVNHGAPPVEVSLAWLAGEGVVEVHVRDHGPGIPEELRDEVFTDFGRAGDAGPGYGLGLAIATELARVNGGTLTYRDPEGPGACFVLSLPVATT